MDRRRNLLGRGIPVQPGDITAVRLPGKCSPGRKRPRNTSGKNPRPEGTARCCPADDKRRRRHADDSETDPADAYGTGFFRIDSVFVPADRQRYDQPVSGRKSNCSLRPGQSAAAFHRRGRNIAGSRRPGDLQQSAGARIPRRSQRRLFFCDVGSCADFAGLCGCGDCFPLFPGQADGSRGRRRAA